MGFFDILNQKMKTQRQLEMDDRIERSKAQIDAAMQAQQAKLQYTAYAQANAYDPYAGQLGAQNIYTNVGSAGACVTTGITAGTGYVTSGIIAPGSINNNVNAVYTTANPNTVWSVATLATAPYNLTQGTPVEIGFIDANGKQITLWVDAAFVETMVQIGAMHQAHRKSIPQALPDPDFDLDEMAMAAELLETINGPRPEAI